MKSNEEYIKQIDAEQKIKNSIKLHKAIDDNNIDELEKILAAGNVDTEYEYSGILDFSITPLCKISVLCRRVETTSEDDALKIMQILIKYGADVNREWDGMSPLFYAIGMEPKFSLIKCLLNAGADVNLGSYATPLCTIYSVDVQEILLAYGADMHIKDADSEISHFDKLKAKIEDPDYILYDEFSDDIYKPNYILYNIAAFVNNLFNKASKDDLEKSLSTALKLIDNHTDRSAFMLSRFKSLCAIKNAKLADEEPTNFIEYLERIITYEFLPEKLKTGLQDILKDYQMITDNIEGFALWDAYNIYAKENKSAQIKAPISFKQVQNILVDNYLEDIEIFQSILGFCDEHRIYKNHHYLEHESSKDEITKLMRMHTDCAESIKELYSKYKGVFYSDSIEQAINNCNAQKQLFETVKEIGVSAEDNHTM